ncbi:MAG: MerR family transcriptional regulator [Muribaculaceae bacterium]|nr:MerR family transcriptional regulator [Muribaculaceae bacterium]
MEDSFELTKKFYKIKDVSEIIGVPQTTLRFWESEFPEIQPRRSSHNQRYYSPEMIQTLKIVHFLVKQKGLKIEAAKEQLKKNRKNISKRIKIIEELIKVKEELQSLHDSLNIRSIKNS